MRISDWSSDVCSSDLEKLTQELVALMEGVHFNNNRLEQLVDQLYGLNRRLLTFEGKMLRMAERCGVDRQDFLDHYLGSELDPRWVSRVKRLAGKGWSRFDERYGGDVKGISTIGRAAWGERVCQTGVVSGVGV